MELKGLSNDELRRELLRLACAEREVVGAVLRHLVEADERRVAGTWGFDSLFGYCTTELRYDEGAAYKRINAARLAARLPVVLEYLEAGKVHLAGLVCLAAHLTAKNVRQVMDRASGMTSRQVQELTAELAPKPDRPDFLRRIPNPPLSPSLPQAGLALPGEFVVPAPPPPFAVPGASAEGLALSAGAPLESPPVRPQAARRHDQVHARSPGRHYVGFTAGDRLRDKLLRAQALMRQSRPGASYEDVVESALDAWLDRRDPERVAFRRESRRRMTPITAKASRSAGRDRPSLPQALRDAVYLRDGGQCTHVSSSGRRCTARVGLEVDHRVPKAKGGTDDLSNLRLLCREHNRTEAVREFGAALVGPQRRGALTPGSGFFEAGEAHARASDSS